MTMNQFHLYF